MLARVLIDLLRLMFLSTFQKVLARAVRDNLRET